MLYFTQIIFIKDNEEDNFNLFESYVLPLLKKYNGSLLYRVRPEVDSVIKTTIGHPYELHLITFPTKADFKAYKDDKERMRHMHLKDAAVEQVLLIEGKLL
jgi:hypothetical protein